MTREESIAIYVGAATLTLSLEDRNDEYSEIWRDVRRVVVRAGAKYMVKGEHDENAWQLCQTLMDYGRVA